MDPQARTMVDNLPEKTGRSLSEWLTVVRAAGHDRHGAIVTFLKTEHGVTHGYANLIAQAALGGLETAEETGDAEERLLAGGKEGLRPLWDAIRRMIVDLGGDVEAAPKKTYVSYRRRRQFALLQPSTRTRVDLGLRLDGVEPAGRLESASGWNSMCSHRVRLTSVAEADAELRKWLRMAYEQAG